MADAVVRNPTENQTAHYGWGGKHYEIKPGEVVVLEQHLADHARKHNGFLELLDESLGKLSAAESKLKLLENDLELRSRELQEKTAQVKRLQVDIIAARARVKAEQEAVEAEVNAGKKPQEKPKDK